MRSSRLIALILILGGCDPILGLLEPADEPSLTVAADRVLQSGDLPGALAAYEQLASEHPESVYVAEGLAYAQLLAGEYDAADASLARVQETAGERAGEIRLRRAIVALRAGDLDAVKALGKSSGLAAGKVLSAEVHLADTETDQARSLLQEAVAAGGAVAETASSYLELLDSGDHVRVGLAEATALWALGQREVAVEAAEELVKALPDDAPRRDTELLLWAGRAATAGRPAIGRNLLDAIDFPPDGQVWRLQATRAILAFAEGKDDEGREIFKSLAAGGAPRDGLSDALATAASLASTRAAAKGLVANVETIAAARGLDAARATAAAKAVAPDSLYRDYLENR